MGRLHRMGPVTDGHRMPSVTGDRIHRVPFASGARGADRCSAQRA
jgi:hypothetical protein